jgi:ubiquinone/menaquinone biosynthesis C-methylase UbiE
MDGSNLKKIPAGYKILDAGAGECQFKKYCTHLNYVSQDFAQYNGDGNVGLQMGSWDNTQLDIVSDITSIPVADGSFDAVMCTEVLEHVPDPVAALKEMNRTLRSGGYLMITVPFASLTHFAPYHFASGLNKFF